MDNKNKTDIKAFKKFDASLLPNESSSTPFEKPEESDSAPWAN